MRLLVVEDDDIVADAITRGLSAANYAVHRVTSAEAAQAALAVEERVAAAPPGLASGAGWTRSGSGAEGGLGNTLGPLDSGFAGVPAAGWACGVEGDATSRGACACGALGGQGRGTDRPSV